MAASKPICPWSFLALSSSMSSQSSSHLNSSPQGKTFAQILNNSCDIPMSQLPRPCCKGDAITVTIHEEDYKAGLERCKFNLHGRLILTKGDILIKFTDLKAKLSFIWKSIEPWNMTSLGKGYYEFSFSSMDDQRSVWSMGSWSLKPGFICMSSWTPDFKPSVQRQTHAQCWVRISNLPQEYWCSRIFFSIAAGIGVPISIDEATSKRNFGHYGRVLVDLDLNGVLEDKIMVEREGYAFFVYLQYENLPAFCKNCLSIGHVVANCKKQVTDENLMKDQAVQNIKIINTNPKKVVQQYVVKDKGDKPIEKNGDKQPSMVHMPKADQMDKGKVHSNVDPVDKKKSVQVDPTVLEVESIHEDDPIHKTPEQLQKLKEDCLKDPNSILGFSHDHVGQAGPSIQNLNMEDSQYKSFESPSIDVNHNCELNASQQNLIVPDSIENIAKTRITNACHNVELSISQHVNPVVHHNISGSGNLLAGSSSSVDQNRRIDDTIVTPAAVKNDKVANDLRTVGKFWGDRVEEEVEEDISSSQQAGHSPDKYLKVAPKEGQGDFTPVLSKSRNKKMRKKAKQAQKDAYNTRSKGGSLSLII